MKAVKVFLALLLTTISLSELRAQEPTTVAPKVNNPTPDISKTAVANNDTRNDERYRIGYQDSLQIIVTKHPDMSATVSVNPNGMIYVPRLDNPIMAVCKTERELAVEIATELKKGLLKNPFVDVRAVDQKSQAFGVIGAVEKPGYFYINKKIQLLEMLAYAGGPNKEAGTRMLVARAGSTSFCKNDTPVADDPNKELQLYEFKIRDVQEAKVNFWMQPGDTVSVLDADWVYVTGNVNKPGRIPLKNPISLTQALATAEGTKPASKKDKILVLRQKPNSSEREQLTFNLKDIQSLKTPDPILQVNDIVAVTEDSTKAVLNGIVKSVTTGFGNLPFILP